MKDIQYQVEGAWGTDHCNWGVENGPYDTVKEAREWIRSQPKGIRRIVRVTREIVDEYGRT